MNSEMKNQRKQCKEIVPIQGMNFGSSQCSRFAVNDGYCKQHHPDAKEARREKSQVLFEKKQEQSPWRKLKLENERAELWKSLALEAGERIQDLIKGDDGQSYSEAARFLEKLAEMKEVES